MNRKDALKRLNGLAPRVEEHLAKIADDPGSRDVTHWVKEIGSWIDQMERVPPDTGDKTEAEWRARIAGWEGPPRGLSMDRQTQLRDLLERVFDSCRDGLRAELPADEYERRRHDFAFHLTDWAGDLNWFADLTKRPDRADVGAVEQKLIGFLYHVVPHLSAAGRLLLGHVPDPFADPAPPPEARAEDHLPVG